jgi:hypothetical protein
MVMLNDQFYEGVKPRVAILEESTIEEIESMCMILEQRPELSLDMFNLFDIAQRYYDECHTSGYRKGLSADVHEIVSNWMEMRMNGDKDIERLYDIYLLATSRYVRKNRII